MKGDFSRLTWDPRRHYGAVLMQQGRLQLDADWNEQIAIVLHRLETETADHLGHSGVPMREAGGFLVGFENAAGGGQQLTVAPGRIYVDGRLLENEDVHRLPVAALVDVQPPPPARAVVYVEAWQRHVTAVDDPRIKDIALGGPDTATRIENAWRVRAEWVPPTLTPADIGSAWQPSYHVGLTTGLLNARVVSDVPALDNRLYRVEVHTDHDDGTVDVTWSRDNAWRSAAVGAVHPGARQVELAAALPEGDMPGERSWVELLTADQESVGDRGPLVQLEQVDGNRLTVTQASWPWSDPAGVPAITVLRPWDSPGGVTTLHTVDADSTDGWTTLENGIEVRLEHVTTAAGVFAPGAYWVFASRSAGADIEWPTADGRPLPQPPAGVERRHAALAVVDVDASGHWSVTQGGDLRRLITSLDQGFVSRGPGGDVMQGPLAVTPLLTAGADGDTLTAVRIEPHFEDVGHAGVTHHALLVHGGLSVGTADRPGSTAEVFGPLTVHGLLDADQVTTRQLSAGHLAVAAPDGPPADPPAQWALQIGAPGQGLAVDATAPAAPALRFGDGSAATSLSIVPDSRAGATGGRAMVTFRGDGRIGIGTPAPASVLHIQPPNGQYVYLTGSAPTPDGPLRQAILDNSFPNNTVVVAGISADGNSLVFYWKRGIQGFVGSIAATDSFRPQVRS